MKRYNYVFTLIAVLVTILTSCTKHSCTGAWNGRGYGKQVIYLYVVEDGTFSLRILPKHPDTYISLYRGRETDYEGEWKSQSDDDIILVCKRKKERYSDYSEPVFSTSSDVFYLRKDGAFCKESPNYSFPIYDLIKQDDN